MLAEYTQSNLHGATDPKIAFYNALSGYNVCKDFLDFFFNSKIRL